MFWTGALRSKEHPWGLLDLTPLQQAKVDEANKVIVAIIALVKLFDKHRLPWIVENPAGSILWLFPFFQELLQRTHVTRTVADYCRFGRPWRKRTAFLSGHIDSLDLDRLDKRCGGTRGLCPWNNDLPHFH